jgi:glycerol-3-phosphate acyltransferase PlsY
MEDNMAFLYLISTVLIAYLVGGVPVGTVIARLNNIDISQHGSGKIGTTNVLRTVGRRAAALVLLGDFLKGTVAVLIARLGAELFIQGDGRINLLGYTLSVVTLASALAAGAAIAGHVWSPYLRLLHGKWQGGRGVATALGATMVINPLIVVAAVLVGMPVIAITRYVSLGSIMGAAAAGLAIILMVAMGQMDTPSLLFIFLPIFIIMTHRDNIERLLKGTERKLGERVKLP